MYLDESTVFFSYTLGMYSLIASDCYCTSGLLITRAFPRPRACSDVVLVCEPESLRKKMSTSHVFEANSPVYHCQGSSDVIEISGFGATFLAYLLGDRHRADGGRSMTLGIRQAPQMGIIPELEYPLSPNSPRDPGPS